MTWGMAAAGEGGWEGGLAGGQCHVLDELLLLLL